MRAIPFAPLFTQRLNRGEFHSSMGAQAVASGRCAYIMTCSCHGYLYSHAAESKKRNHSSVEWVSLFMVSRDSADTFCSFVPKIFTSLSFNMKRAGREKTSQHGAQSAYLLFFLMYKKIAPPTITRQRTIASMVFNSIYDSSSFFFFLSALFAAITRHATTPTPSSVMPMAIGVSYLSESIPSLTDGVLVMVVSKGTSKV